ncbi:MAG: DUF4097 family beta strand repeat protein [Clostridia bacterium]|nr:DUF4097 family beta strand repeat protein [Clostridia bacterium]
MRTAAKVWLIIAAVLVVGGLVLFGIVMSAKQWDFSELGVGGKNQIKTYRITEAFQSISMETDTADICFVPSADGTCRVECCESEQEKHTVVVLNGVLTIRHVDEREWFERISLFAETPKITVYLPAGEYDSLVITEHTGDIELPEAFSFRTADITASTGDVKTAASAERIAIQTSTGDIAVENVKADTMELSVSTGRVTVQSVACTGGLSICVSTGKTQLTDVSCGLLISTGSTGDLSMKNTVVATMLSIERSTGDVRFDGCDAAEITVKTGTGDVTGTLLSDKVFLTETGTGRIDVPKSTVGGRCEIKTDTGDIKIDTVG